MTYLETLQKLTVTLLDESRPAYSLKKETDALRALFTDASGFSPSEAIAEGETRTRHGVAISPTMAAMCLDDFARTVQFIRGLREAVVDAKAEAAGRPVRVLYAGCGPWATLAVPIMSVVRDVKFTLIDIHAESIRSALAMIETLGLSDSVEHAIVCDAAEYRIDNGKEPDIVLVEMMRAALEAEPQIPVAAHLVRQAPAANLIPEEIRLGLTLINAAREFGMGEELARDRIPLGSVLTIDRPTLLADRPLREYTVRIPDFDRTRYHPMICTQVRVYNEYLLTDYDSGITSPRSIAGAVEMRSGDTLRFSFELGPRPRLRVAKVS